MPGSFYPSEDATSFQDLEHSKRSSRRHVSGGQLKAASSQHHRSERRQPDWRRLQLSWLMCSAIILESSRNPPWLNASPETSTGTRLFFARSSMANAPT